MRANIALAGQGAPVMPGVVTESGERACKVKLRATDVEMEDVAYLATLENEKGFVLVPKVGCNVLVAPIGGDENSLHLVSVDEVEKVRLVLDTGTLTMDKHGMVTELSEGKFAFKNAGADLKTLLTDLVDMVAQLTVSTAQGPSGTPLPPTVAKANEIKRSINALLN